MTSRPWTIPAVALLALVTLSQSSIAATPTMDEIVTGFRALNAPARDRHIRFHQQTQRTDHHFQSEKWQWDQISRARQIRRPPAAAREETSVYDLYEKQDLRMWTQVGKDGSLRRQVAFDGTVVRQYDASDSRNVEGLIYRQQAAPKSPYTTPLELLNAHATLQLVEWLQGDAGKVEINGTRDVDGETLVDLILDYAEPNTANAPSPRRLSMTIDVSRQFWPIFGRLEILVPNATPKTMVEIEATGWIQSGEFVYPRIVEQRTFTPAPPPGSSRSVMAAGQEHLLPWELDTIQRTEILELAINNGLADAIFAPPFPEGVVISDQRDGTLHEVNAAGDLVTYTPRPKGLRGAVFGYHLLWLSGLAIYGLTRWYQTASPRSIG